MMAGSAAQWTAQQLIACGLVDLAGRGGGPSRPQAYNPRPPGRVVPGGAPEAVLEWLMSRRSRRAWWDMHQIIRGTGRSGKACCWAVIYLHRVGLIERTRSDHHGRFLRYRAAA